jgi:hypothetical protein
MADIAAAPLDLHSKLVQWFETSEDATQDSRKMAERDADYYDGKQLTREELAVLKRRKQPPVVNNRIKPKIDFMLGAELKTRTDPKAFPRNPKVDEDAANAATDALRYVCDATKFERVRSLCYEDGLKYGSYGGQIVVTPKGKDFKIEFVHVPWDRIFYDSHSRAKDFSDAKYKGVVIWQDREDALAMFPGKGDELANTMASVTAGQTFDDKPQNRWADQGRDRVRVVYMEYRKDGEWYFCYLTKSGFLREPAKIPFVNDDGESIPSLEFQSLFVDRDGNRYGQIRQHIDMQDEINKRRSKGIHLINSRQTKGEKGAVDDVNAAKRELAKPDGHVEVNPGLGFELLNTTDMSAGNFNMLQEAKAEIDAQGPNAAMVGAEKRDLSGRAIQALQGGSNTETAIQTDGLRDWEHRVYRLMWYCIKKYWTAEKWFRVTDDENAPKYVGLNTTSTAGEQFIKKAEKEGRKIDPGMMQQIMADPAAQQPVVVNNVAELDVDIVLEDVPDTVTIQQEQFEALTQIYPTVPDQLKPLTLEMLIQASSLRNKQKFIDKLQGKGEDQQPDPMQEMQQQFQKMMMDLEAKQKEADIAKTETESMLNVAKAEAAEMGQQLAEYKAVVDSLMQVMGQQPQVEPQPQQTA